LILYRKSPQLRLQRAHVPAPPWWAATTIAPYGPKRGFPVSIDYLALTASAPDRAEVNVCENVRDELERATQRRPVDEPALIDATELAEVVFARADEALRFCAATDCGVIHLVSTRGVLPANVTDRVVVAIAAWPLDLDRLTQLFADARARSLRWGVFVPIVFPITTQLDALAQLAAAAEGATFFAAVPIDADANARKAIAQTKQVSDDRETYEMLFHADLEPLQTATERHVAALAAEIGADDFVVPPRWERRSNWNGAVLLTLTATRMLAMKLDVETASRIARSARLVAQLEKPIERIAEAANLSIVEALDEISIDALTEWLETGRSSYVDHVNKQWRLRRDRGI